MREILFKAKRKDNGEWAYGDLVHNRYIEDDRIFIQRYQKYITSDFYDDDIVEIMPETISQFTGLTDKNGVKIFENDIVDFASKKCTVKYGEYHFSACDEYDCERMGNYIETSKGGGGYVNTNTGVPLENICKHYEVIGNIFDEEVK